MIIYDKTKGNRQATVEVFGESDGRKCYYIFLQEDIERLYSTWSYCREKALEKAKLWIDGAEVKDGDKPLNLKRNCK